MRSLIVAGALLAGVSSPALAQDDSANSNFTGPRAEVTVGYDRLGGSGDAIQGLAFGGGVGFDFDLGGIVAGAEAEYMESTGGRDNIFEDEDTDFTGVFDVSRDIYVGGRIGFRVTPTTLFYGKGGYTNTKLDFGIDTGTDDEVDADGTIDGYRLGAGIEQVVETNTLGNGYAKLEYRYSSYGSFSFDDDLFEESDVDSDLDLDRHQVVASFGIRF